MKDHQASEKPQSSVRGGNGAWARRRWLEGLWALQQETIPRAAQPPAGILRVLDLRQAHAQCQGNFWPEIYPGGLGASTTIWENGSGLSAGGRKGRCPGDLNALWNMNRRRTNEAGSIQQKLVCRHRGGRPMPARHRTISRARAGPATGTRAAGDTPPIMTVSVPDPASHPRQEEEGRNPEHEGEHEENRVAEALGREPRPAAHETGQAEEGGQHGVLRRRLVLVADPHQERQEGGGAETGGERLG